MKGMQERMASLKLPEDAMIADITASLDNPADYVRGVLGNMVEYRKEHGSAVARIGITGRGIAPHYRIEPISESNQFIDDILTGGDDLEKHFVAFHGRNHKRLDWSSQELRGSHWSRGRMDFEGVQRLLGELRNYKAKPK
jgi:hypothetical protein